MVALTVLLWMMVVVCLTLAFVIVRYVVLNTPTEMVTAWKNLTLLGGMFVVGWLLASGLGVFLILHTSP